MKPSLLLLGLLLPGGAAAQQTDITGRWVIEHAASQNGETYGGEVIITPLGSCYAVEWLLDGGARYTGVGIVRDSVLVVAYADPTAASEQYSVVAYAPAKAGGFEGSSCQINGTSGSEVLGGPDSLTGTHQISRAAGTGSVTLGPFGGSATNYRMHRSTTQGERDGFGTLLAAAPPVLGGIWGIPQGGVALYTMGEPNKLVGLWAAVGTTGQGEETLRRP
jgi:hypothetical protein